MQAIRSILVVIEPEHSESLALKRAKLIAGVTQAHLHLLVCDRKHDHSGMLGVLKAALLQDGYSVTTEQAWNESLHETIVDVQVIIIDIELGLKGLALLAIALLDGFAELQRRVRRRQHR